MNGQPPPIVPSRKWDWFDVDFDLGRAHAAAPGVRYVDRTRKFSVHRTHLPLIPGGVAILAERTAPLRDHATRAAQVEPAGITLRSNQQTGLDFIEPRHGVLLADEMRLGKLQWVDSKILTPGGWRRLGDLQLGDRIVDPDGGEGVVEGLYPQGVQASYRVTTCDGASTECGLDHLWLVYTFNDRHRGGPGRVLPLRDFKDRLRAPACGGRSRGNRNFFLPLTSPVVFDPVELPPIAPYILGVLIGDGSLAHGSITVTKPDVEVRHAVAALLPSDLEVRVRRTAASRCPVWAICPRVRAGFNIVQRTLQDLGLTCTSPFKFIPKVYLRGTIDQRVALLRGLMDTDGDVTLQNVTCFNTTSKQLADDVLELVQSLGGFASVGEKTPTYTYLGKRKYGLKSYRLHIRIAVNPFALPRKANRWKVGSMARGIESVEYVGDKETMCIKVSTQRRLYITDGHIVTHNTLTALAAHDPSRGPLLIVAPLSTRSVWLQWIARLWPGVDPLVLRGKTMDVDALQARPEIVFCHFDVLIHHRLGSFQPATLIVDEAHMLSNARADRTKAIFFYASVAWRTLLLTGTPLWNTSRGLWSLLAATNPGAWGSLHDFSQRYCQPQLTEYGWQYTGVSNADEWALRRDEVLIARRWEDVRADLPPTQWTTEIVDLGPKDQLEIDRLAFELRRNPTAPLVESLNYYRQATGAFKVPLAVDYAKRTIAEQRDLVVWVWHRKVGVAIATALRKLGVPVMLVNGELADGARTAMIDAWKTSPVPAVLVISIDVGQVGIDLSRAHHALFVELSWNPVELSQAAMRTFSPDRPMEITYFVLNHEIDNDLVSAIVSKVARGSALGTLAAGSTFAIPMTTAIDDDELMAAFARAIR